MKSLIGILLLISLTCAGLFYLYSDGGIIQQLEKENAAKIESTKK
ncbi:MAG: hypothetical protein ACI81I_000594 [Arcobacteraceae bacterium]|jgi:hypothetical protein